ncbi:MAG: hypothetical protein KC488_09740, partial [Candidatus Cloacimonetes bacterium]|nr:hypothetical protein [Candidatus Cloacimonadota bacterium]
MTKEEKLSALQNRQIHVNMIFESVDCRAILEHALQLGSGQVITLIEEADLRGRGGAGFPTGRKWAMAARQPGDRKFVICNADEG